MISFKYLIYSIMIMSFTTLFLFGCKSSRYTTKFEVTPVMEDGMTSTQRLTDELNDEMRMEDEKRMQMLQEKAKEKREREGKATGSSVDTGKGE